MGELAGAALGSSRERLDAGRFATLPDCGILVSVDAGRFAPGLQKGTVATTRNYSSSSAGARTSSWAELRDRPLYFFFELCI